MAASAKTRRAPGVLMVLFAQEASEARSVRIRRPGTEGLLHVRECVAHVGVESHRRVIPGHWPDDVSTLGRVRLGPYRLGCSGRRRRCIDRLMTSSGEGQAGKRCCVNTPGCVHIDSSAVVEHRSQRRGRAPSFDPGPNIAPAARRVLIQGREDRRHGRCYSRMGFASGSTRSPAGRGGCARSGGRFTPFTKSGIERMVTWRLCILPLAFWPWGPAWRSLARAQLREFLCA
jgi:hypothetical protein